MLYETAFDQCKSPPYNKDKLYQKKSMQNFGKANKHYKILGVSQENHTDTFFQNKLRMIELIHTAFNVQKHFNFKTGMKLYSKFF